MKNIYHACLMGVLLFSPALHAQTGTVNGHEYVDLGLSVKWATCNVGASAPSDYGDYFAWGETYTKSTYLDKNYKTMDKELWNIAGNSSYDTAASKWGSSWRMPTKAELQELIDNCEWTASDMGEHGGFIVKSKRNGNSIFLPADGSMYGTNHYHDGVFGHYWSSTTCTRHGYNRAYALYIAADPYYKVEDEDPVFGYSVRPVTK